MGTIRARVSEAAGIIDSVQRAPAYAIVSMDFDVEPERLYRKAIDITPTFLEAHARLGDYYADLDEIEHAIEEYQAAISLNSNYDRAYLALGITLLEATRLEEAE